MIIKPGDIMKNAIRITIALSLFLYTLVTPCASLQAQDVQKLTIAVLPLSTKGGVTENEAGTLSDRLRSELVNLGKFSVVERGQMNAILEEQGFSQSGCIGSECAIEAGKLLGVRLMVTGDVGKIGNVLTIDVRMFDVTTGKIVRAIQEDYSGDVSGLLGVMKTIAHKLAGVKEEKKKSGGFPWLWVTLAAVVIGGGTAALLMGGGDGGEDDGSNLPAPAWPPGSSGN